MVTAATILKLASPALQKAGNLAFQKIKRLQSINDALEGIEDNKLSKKVIEDFEIVKGSWRGEFTKTVDKFLRSFEASGLDVMMLNSALLQTRSQSNRDTFLNLFEVEAAQPRDNGALLYDQIASSFEVSTALLTNDPVMSRMIRLNHSFLVSSVAKLDAAIEGVRLGINRRPTIDEINEIIPRIVRSVAGDTKHIRVETSQGPKEIEVSKIYIAPRLRLRNSEEMRIGIKAFVENNQRDPRGKRDLTRSFSLESPKVENDSLAVSLDELMFISKTVVLGNPGGGKSTLLQSVCQKLALDSLKRISEGSPVSDVRVPIRIILRDYEHARAGNTQLSIIEYIANDLLNSAYADKTVLTRRVENLLATGRAYLAFDGLDEILKTANRRQFVDIVNRFVRQYPLCQVLVTSREVGYDNAPLASGEYEELLLGDFHDYDVKTYAERFIRFLGKKRVAEARNAASHFMIQTSQNASDLRRNPLMLGLMMWIFNIRDDVPSNRPEIYQECARLMFERWDGDRNIIVDLPQTFDRLQVFSYLASKIFEDEDLSAGVNARWIEREIRVHLSEVLESAPQAQAAAGALVQFIVDRSWVMSEKGEGVFAFTHQTFLEYFFAKFQDDTFDTVDDLFDILQPHIIQDEWDVVSRLSLQIKTDRNRRRQDEAISKFVQLLESEDSNDIASRAILGFAVRCMEFLVGSEAKVRRLVEATLNAMIRCYKSGLMEVMDLVPLIFTGAKERRSFVLGAAEQWLLDKFKSELDDDRDFVLAFVDGRTNGYGLGGTYGTCLSAPIELVKRVRGKIIPVLLTEFTTRQSSAKLLFEWTGTISKSSIDRFGLGFIHYARPESTISMDGLSGLPLGASGRYSTFFSDSQLTKQKAESSLKAIGNYVRRNGVSGLKPFAHIGDLNNPPASIWVTLLKGMKADAELRLGAIVSSYLESQNFGGSPEDNQRSREYARELTRQESLVKTNGELEVAGLIGDLCRLYERDAELFSVYNSATS